MAHGVRLMIPTNGKRLTANGQEFAPMKMSAEVLFICSSHAMFKFACLWQEGTAKYV